MKVSPKPLEYRGLSCPEHGMCAFQRKRGSVEPWVCVECNERGGQPHILVEMAREALRGL